MSDVDLSLQVVKLSEELRKAGGWPGEEVLNRLAVQIGAAFGARKDEVAILFFYQDMLSFVYPVKFAHMGAIPISSSRSLAVKTVRDRHGEIVNNFSTYKHPTVFEGLSPSEGAKAAPIQKIMSVPMIAEGKVTGVIQVSRKGTPGDPLGPDFTPQNLTDLTTAGAILAKVFLKLVPPGRPSAPPAKR